MRPFDRTTAWVTIDRGEPETLAGFLAANEGLGPDSGLEPEDVEALIADLAAGRPHSVGGGAAPLILIERSIVAENRAVARQAIAARIRAAFARPSAFEQVEEASAVHAADASADAILSALEAAGLAIVSAEAPALVERLGGLLRTYVETFAADGEDSQTTVEREARDLLALIGMGLSEGAAS